jgi:metal iron transporter
MNYPSRNDETLGHPGWNQSPSSLTADLTTNEDLNGIANTREHQGHGETIQASENDLRRSKAGVEPGASLPKDKPVGRVVEEFQAEPASREWTSSSQLRTKLSLEWLIQSAGKIWMALVKFARFIGPGFLIAVAYIDPGNYATDVAAGAVTEYSLLFIVLMSNCFAIFLQTLCIKLGSVTGRNLAEMCREHLPRWLTLVLYIFSEAAIIATDIAEVT